MFVLYPSIGLLLKLQLFPVSVVVVTVAMGQREAVPALCECASRNPSRSSSEKVCTYDRCGQCFGELELFYDQGPQIFLYRFRFKVK